MDLAPLHTVRTVTSYILPLPYERDIALLQRLCNPLTPLRSARRVSSAPLPACGRGAGVWGVGYAA